MLALLKNIDHQLYYFINIYLGNGFLDVFFTMVRNRLIWFPLYFFAAFFIFGNYKQDGWKIIFFAILTILFADQLSSSLLKPLIARPRPCNNSDILSHIPRIRLVIECGAGYSMPSSHASNHFSLAVFLGIIFFKKSKYLFLVLALWALIIGFAQVYVGVHYPADILVGAIVGGLVGYSMALLCRRSLSKKFDAPPLPSPPRRRRRTNLMDYAPPINNISETK